MGGTSIGILFGAQSLGASVAPLVAGMIADRYGPRRHLLVPRRRPSWWPTSSSCDAEGSGSGRLE
jgi:MFS family permease